MRRCPPTDVAISGDAVRPQRYRRSSSRSGGPLPALMNLPTNKPTGIESRNQARRNRSTFSTDHSLTAAGSTEHDARSAIATIVQGGCPVRQPRGRVLGSLLGVVRPEGPREQSFCLGIKFYSAFRFVASN